MCGHGRFPTNDLRFYAILAISAPQKVFASVYARKISLALLDVRYLQRVRVFCRSRTNFDANWRSGHFVNRKRFFPLIMVQKQQAPPCPFRRDSRSPFNFFL